MMNVKPHHKSEINPIGLHVPKLDYHRHNIMS